MQNIKVIACCVVIAGLSACQSTGVQSKDNTAPYQNLKISLEREACFGTCPTYVVEISQDGAVDFCGINFVELPGERSRQVDPQKVRELYAQVTDANFFDLRDSYRGLVTDMPTYTITVTVDGRQKTVLDYAGSMDGMPETVTELQKMIDATAGVDAWVGKGLAAPITEQFKCGVEHQKKKYAAP